MARQVLASSGQRALPLSWPIRVRALAFVTAFVALFVQVLVHRAVQAKLAGYALPARRLAAADTAANP